MRDDWQGKLFPVWEVQCGVEGCQMKDWHGSHLQRATQTSAERWFRRLGWRHSTALGWICPQHATGPRNVRKPR